MNSEVKKWNEQNSSEFQKREGDEIESCVYENQIKRCESIMHMGMKTKYGVFYVSSLDTRF
jgi:hypothetical protein